MGDELRAGVYLCTCEGEIERVIDLDALSSGVSGLTGVSSVSRHEFLCSEEGLQKIKADIDRLGLDRIVIAACSPFFKEREFSELGLNSSLVERVNIREQCSRVHSGEPEKAAAKAKALLMAGIEKARYAVPQQSSTVPALKSAAVIGGGIAGINAALDVAGTGSEAFIIEKRPFLGGKVNELNKYFPRICPPSCGLEIFYSNIRGNPNIHVMTGSIVDKVSGSPGNYDILIKTSPRYINEETCILCDRCLKACPKNAIIYPEGFSYPSVPSIRRDLCEEGCRECAEVCPVNAINLDEEERTASIKAGAIVVATGWEPFDPSHITELGYGRLKNVITNLEFEKVLKDKQRHDERPQKTAFIQCVGSRDERYLSYCSDVCCTVSIKQALTLKQADPENEIYIFYNDIRTPGEYEELYREARKSGVIFIKGIPSELIQKGDDKIGLSVFDTTAGERFEFTFNLVVLATGMKPSESNIELKEKIGIPLNRNNFIESHLQCFPQDTQRQGIFSAGACRAPMDVSRSIESAGTAAVKAVQFFNSTVEISSDFPSVNTLKCDVCKRCMEECPFKAFSFDEKGFPKADVLKCRSCGICMGSCPLTAISLGGLTIDQLAGMIDVIDKNFLGEDEPVVLGFLCRNDAYRAVDDAGMRGMGYPPNFLGIMLPCAGAVNSVVVAQAISSGFDGVLVAGCPERECHYIQGSALAKTRLNDISEKLKEMYLEPERVRFVDISRDESEKFISTVKNFVKELRIMGKNPLRI